jgi:hypothetical protein
VCAHDDHIHVPATGDGNDPIGDWSIRQQDGCFHPGAARAPHETFQPPLRAGSRLRVPFRIKLCRRRHIG